MKHLLASIVRDRSPWQLLAIACISAGLGLWLVYYCYASTLKTLRPLLLLLFSLAALALILAIHRRAEAAEPRMLQFLAAILGLAGLISFTTYSLGHHRRTMVSGCNAARLPDTLAEREQAIAAAESNLRSPFAWLPNLLDDAGAARECSETRDDFTRVARGLCTKWPLVDHPCTCGAESYPYKRCEQPVCMYEPGRPDRFDCPGDPLPDPP